MALIAHAPAYRRPTRPHVRALGYPPPRRLLRHAAPMMLGGGALIAAVMAIMALRVVLFVPF